MKILHLGTDEKFINAARKSYEIAFPDQNYFLILGAEDKSSLKNISFEDGLSTLSQKNCFKADRKEQIEDLIRESKVLVFHGLGPMHRAVFETYPEISNKIFVWSVYGIEVYGLYKVKKSTFAPKTFFKFLFWPFLKEAVNDFLGRNRDQTASMKILKQADYVSILYQEEVDLYRKYELIKKEAKRIAFTYYPADFIIERDAPFVDGKNILLGNSASYSNNHLDAFHHLKKQNLDEIGQVICPLNYGDLQYAKLIAQEGKTVLGDQFDPLLDFMALKDYQRLLQSCSIALMYHYRQQAVGNVLNLIYLGAKVYLSKKNSLYWFLKRIGIKVFSIEEDLVASNASAFAPLSESEMKDNRSKILKEISLDQVVKELKTNLSQHL
tara:strand:+ start:81 stop:1226 length:1146 start_codon:yes stop_codon:yes gene_type:complete